jgi:hypothetical protein
MSSPQGRKALRSLRFRLESANGTRVAPRFIYRGMGSLTDARTQENPEEQIGIFGGGDRTYQPALLGELSLDETDLTFEQFSDFLLMAGMGTMAAYPTHGSAQGNSGSTAVFAFIIPSDTAPPTYSYTVEGGENAVEAEYMPYTLVKKISIKGAGGEALKVSYDLVGRFVERTNDEGTFSAVGTARSVETILAAGSWWITPAGSGFGTGQVTPGNILAFEMDIEPAWKEKYSVDSGTIYPGTFVYTDLSITGKITMEFQRSGTYGAAGTGGQKAKWRNQETQLLRTYWPGGTIPIGTTYSNKFLQIDIPFKWSKFSPLGDMDGNSIVEGEFFSKYTETTPSAGRGTIVLVRRGTSEFAGAN